MNWISGAPLLVAGAILASAAQGQETINMTVISGNAPQFAGVYAVTNAFIPAVDAALAKTGTYKINWNEAYSGQIAKPRGELEAVETGLGDIGVVVMAYTPDKLPLHQIAFSTPFASSDIHVATDAISHMQETFPAFQDEWARFNQYPLRNSAVVDNYMLFTTVPVKSVGDLNGLKISAVGANLPWVQAAGAAAITGEISTSYNSLQTGVYEGTLLWNQIAAAMKICEPANHALDAGLGGSPTVELTVNLDVWNGLPDEVKTAFEEGAEKWHEMNMQVLLDGAKSGEDACVGQFGMEVTKLSDEERAAWAAAMPPLGQEWADRATARGEPGPEMMTAWMDYLRSQGQTPLREWDQR